MYPIGRAFRFFLLIGFCFFILLLHSIDKKQTYARLEFIDATSDWFHLRTQDSGQGQNRTLIGHEKSAFEICEQSYDVKFPTDSGYVSQEILESIYLNSESFVIEVGGFEGELMRKLFQLYDVGFYVVVEPIWKFYKNIIKKSKHLPQGRIQALNIGLGAEDDTRVSNKVKASGNHTNVYNEQTKHSESENGENGNEPERILDVNIIGVDRFFKEIGFGTDNGVRGHGFGIDNKVRGQLDLLILDCEGCEYDVFDYLLKSPDLMRYIRVIMFRPHRFKGHTENMIRRYCYYQEMLPLTHEILFKKKFSWEIWTLRIKM
ncbi:uncharacterized protein [Argopecten irradians]|uniref:uncharacterized protein n=1 Tax=Argopecten irradians TaxID=31199 RepID=UPI00371F0205